MYIVVNRKLCTLTPGIAPIRPQITLCGKAIIVPVAVYNNIDNAPDGVPRCKHCAKQESK